MYEIGADSGRYYSLNVPLREGIDDASKSLIIVHETFVYWKPLNRYFANSEDPDEMKHNAAFHQHLHCLLRLK